MSYIALYRKYRPSIFEDIIGQENVTKILRNQIKSGKISHAYIFSGTRGTGKTSAAKVFARAINCLNPHDGEPCNECKVCNGILDGSITDVVEMDAASNNSVENIRQIRQEVAYATIDVKYRVYIIDEAHMLTTSAFNALLKTLEEPPENVVFILATTEQHKIPVTILSRCLRFDFNRLSEDNILQRLEYVLKSENVQYEKEAIKYISKLADGALRDALSILDRCISEDEDKLTLDQVMSIVGAIDREIINKIVDNIYSLNSIEAINNVDEIIKKGKDLRQFIAELTEKFLDKLINLEDVNEKTRIISIIDRLSKLDNDIRNTYKPEILLKSTLVELCNIQSAANINSAGVDMSSINLLNKKIEMLENELEKLKTVKYTNNSNPIQNEEDNARSGPKSNISVNKLNSFNDSEVLKKLILEKGKIKIYSAIASAKLYLDNDVLYIITENSFAYNLLRTQENIDTIANIYKEKYNKEVLVKLELIENNKKEELKIEKLFKENNVDYEKMD